MNLRKILKIRYEGVGNEEGKRLNSELHRKIEDSILALRMKKIGQFEQQYRRLLLHYFTVSIHRNIDAHNKSAEMILGRANNWRFVNVISAVVLFVATTSDATKYYISKVDLRSHTGHLGYFADWMFPLDPVLVLIIIGLLFLSTNLFQSLGRFEDSYFSHKTAASSFSELRRDMLDAMGLLDLSEERIKRFREQYQIIVENSPMSNRKAWKISSDRAEDQLAPLLRMLYSLAHTADGGTESDPISNGRLHDEIVADSNGEFSF